MTLSEIADYLRENGWHTWYNENYWVNPEIVADKNSQDYTNYGMSISDAYKWQKENLGKVKQIFGMPMLNIVAHASEHIRKKEKGQI